MKQKEIFLSGEGDQWFERNHNYISGKDYSSDPVIQAIKKIHLTYEKPVRVLEIGCSEGKRLKYIRNNFNAEVFGIEPSTKAVEIARSDGIDCHIGTADLLPFDNSSFDIVIFGFCLYLCDEPDLFKIAQEADRVSKEKSWVIINDFYTKSPYKNNYTHAYGVKSHKMDYSSIFTWNPSYTCFFHEIYDHGKGGFTDRKDDWVVISVLRKSYDK